MEHYILIVLILNWITIIGMFFWIDSRIVEVVNIFVDMFNMYADYISKKETKMELEEELKQKIKAKKKK